MDYRHPDCSGLTALALRLTKHLALAKAAEGRNLVFSPLSIYAALALVAEGARGGTQRELLDALGAESRVEVAALVRDLAGRALADRSPSGGPAVAFASGVWHDAAWALQPAFRHAAAASYKAEAGAVDFANKPQEAASEINRWVAAATNNLIGSILDPGSVPRDTRLVLANAIYFKGEWDEPFAASRTTEDKFHRLDGRAVTASFMRSGKRQYIAERDGFKVLSLRYKAPPDSQRTAFSPASVDSQSYFMCVVLPDAHDGLPELVDRVASDPGLLLDNMPERRVSVGELRLPKFKLSFSGSLMGVLRDDMGINAVFDADRADLSDMAWCDSTSLPLFVADVRHKAVIEVNEEGTEAAAVTYGYAAPGCALIRPPRVDFVADHPFMFFVIEEVSGAIVFAGHVLDPSASQ